MDKTIYFLTCFNHHGTIAHKYIYKTGKCPHCAERFQSCSPNQKIERMFTCSICKNLTEVHFNEETNKRLIDTVTCFYCDFWQEKIRWREAQNPDCFVIGGVHYKVAPETGQKGLGAGYGGNKFIIQPFDRQRPQIVTHNLWCQGDIPEHFRSILTDNAEFVTK